MVDKVIYTEIEDLQTSGEDAANLINDSKRAINELVEVVNVNKVYVDKAETHQHARTEAEFFAGMARNKNEFIASGLVEYGTHYLSANLYENVNEGLWTDYAKPNRLQIGSRSIDPGTSKSGEAIIVVNGVLHKIYGSLYGDTVSHTGIISPEACTGKKTYDTATGQQTEHLTPALAFAAETATNKVITSRKDFIMVESFHEVISGTGGSDRYSPLGNVQYGATTFEGVTLNNSTTPQGYHAFGTWDTTTRGYDASWVGMTAAQQSAAFANTFNNLYVNTAGDVVMVKYRIRVIEGLGNEWQGITTVKPNPVAAPWGKLFYGAGPTTIRPQGTSVSTGGDLQSEVSGSGGAGTVYVARDEHLGASIATDATDVHVATAIAYKGLCFAIPICLVQRLNQGAYSPSLNPNGCAFIGDATGGSGRNSWHSSLVKTLLSEEDAFTEVTTQSNGGGKIGDGDSGRPGARYYNAIYASQVTDLRLQAQYPTPTQLEPDYWHNKAVAGGLKNYVLEGAPRTVVKERGTVEAYANRVGQDNGFSVSNVSDYSVGDFAIIINQDNAAVAFGYVRFLGASHIELTSTYTNAISGTADTTTTRTQGAIYTILKVEYSTATDQEMTWTDVIGDPVNYPRQWTGVIDHLSSEVTQHLEVGYAIHVDALTSGAGVIGNVYLYLGTFSGDIDLRVIIYNNTTNYLDLGPLATFLANATGFDGVPLLYGEDGGALIPDGNSKEFKFNRKVTDSLGGLRYTNKGVSYSTFSTWNASMESSANSLTGAIPAGEVNIVTYKTPAHIFVDDVNSEVLGGKLGSVSGFAFNGANMAAYTSNLIGKVPVSLYGGEKTPVKVFSQYENGKLHTASVVAPSHELLPALSANATGPAAKSLPYLSRDNAQGKLMSVVKEMSYDSGNDTANEATSASGTSAVSFTAGTYYQLTSGAFVGTVVYCVSNCSVIFDNDMVETSEGDFLLDTNSVKYFERWDGDGWGDNNKFVITDNTTTFTDNNGTICLASTKSTVVPIIIK